MALYFTFDDIEIDKDRANAKRTYQDELKSQPDLALIDKLELQSDIVRSYIWGPHNSFD